MTERVTVDPRLGAVLSAAAARTVAAADQVRLHPDLPEAVAAAFARDLGAVGPEAPTAGGTVVELVPGHAGAPPGTELLEAVRVMDRLRSPGGCPWDAAQTPESLLRYLVEETYELYDAVAAGDRDAVREELGDVLLQVLFHARIAQEDPADPFGVDVVAGELVAKLVSRHPHVFGDGETITGADEQQVRWEELKAVEKRRESALDGVAAAQPGAALLGKYVSRALRAGVPPELLAPAGDGIAGDLAALVVDAVRAGDDPEGALRAAATELSEHVRGAEAAARAAGETLGPDRPEAWRAHWS
ncbi:nucleoside triphosphate pyrophosphohydrolase [Actinomycetospora sp. NBRC 106375]|uniref:MazG family protein n=1 Tax=Actinomycetospora sp. NBRC 106375 TaxID=3032207 RepID=UPI0024A1D702|nr:MazG family protein [Actinomycetospora sp. NBRC 106375]GLZ46833.1 nucleoside triphosphate pyrophosphohydrolase [Actinomycetospora sp. NBRC 106375]